jgi:hypothetical protein
VASKSAPLDTADGILPGQVRLKHWSPFIRMFYEKDNQPAAGHGDLQEQELWPERPAGPWLAGE